MLEISVPADKSVRALMSVKIERLEDQSLIRLEGEITVTSAAELRNALLQGLASGRDLRLDLERSEAVDVTIMQLIWAAGREADRTGAKVAIRVPESVSAAARDAGFEKFPG